MNLRYSQKSVLVLAFLLPICSFFLFSDLKLNLFSNDLDEYESQLDEKKEEKEKTLSQLEQVKAEIERIQDSGYSLDQQIRLINAELKRVEEEMEQVEEDLKQREEDISLKEEDLSEKQEYVEEISGKLYKNSRYSFLEILFRQGNDDGFLQTLIFSRFVIASQISYMKEVIEEIRELQEERDDLEKQKEIFEKDQEEFEESRGLLAAERGRIQGQLSERVATRGALTRRIGGLERDISELQNFLLLMRSGGTAVNVENLGTGDGPGSLSYFRNNAPSGSFAVFSFGASTHGNGMSQWGAKARSDAGQSYREILDFYYSGAKFDERDDLMKRIEVDRFGKIEFEEHYLMGIREINGAWNTEANMNILKAQVIAARSYAVARTGNGVRSICATQNCQVYSNNHYGGAWAKAVEETRGMILTDGKGNAVSTQYAAVHGGWIDNLKKYDVRSSSGSWIDNAWDNISGVSWFYRNWYDRVDRNNRPGSGVTCSTHPNPWLTNAEMADIVNAYLYWSHPSVESDSRLTAVDIATCWGKSGANPYSTSELKEKVREVGLQPVNSVSRAVVTNSNGWTTSISFAVDGGRTVTVSNPVLFRDVYNMRAPAYFAIPQENDQNPFIHINIEMK